MYASVSCCPLVSTTVTPSCAHFARSQASQRVFPSPSINKTVLAASNATRRRRVATEPGSWSQESNSERGTRNTAPKS